MEKLRAGHADKSEKVPDDDDDYVILQADSVEELVKQMRAGNVPFTSLREAGINRASLQIVIELYLKE